MLNEEQRLEKRLRPLQNVAPDALVLHEIYASVQGESTYAGLPCVFVRTTACNLRCTYCDTPHAFSEGSAQSLDAVVEKVRSFGIPLVEVTGGEPLLQKNALVLMQRLCDLGLTVLVETGGSLDIGGVDKRVRRIVDIKTPDSGEVEANLWSNLELLNARDEVKFVLGGRADYEWACEIVRRHRITEKCTVLFGPIWGKLAPSELAAWIVADKMPVRMQVQIHKYIWDPKARGV